MNQKQALKIVNMRVKREYKSLAQAAEGIGIDYSHLTGILRGAKPLTNRVAKWAGLTVSKQIVYTYEVLQ